LKEKPVLSVCIEWTELEQ